MLFNENYFTADRELIRRVGESTGRRRVKEEIDDYFNHPANVGWVRRTLRVRLSTHAVRRLAHLLFDGAASSSGPEGPSEQPWAKPSARSEADLPGQHSA